MRSQDHQIQRYLQVKDQLSQLQKHSAKDTLNRGKPLYTMAAHTVNVPWTMNISRNIVNIKKQFLNVLKLINNKEQTKYWWRIFFLN